MASGHLAQSLFAILTSEYEAGVQFVPPNGPRSTWWLDDTGQSQGGRPCYFLVARERNRDLRVTGNSTSETARLSTIVREPGNVSAQFQLIAEGEHVRIVNRGSRLAIGLPSTYQLPHLVQSSECLTADSGLFKMTRLSMRSGVDVAYLAAKEKLDAARQLLQERAQPNSGSPNCSSCWPPSRPNSRTPGTSWPACRPPCRGTTT
ncbi:hypothetical protein SF23_01100 [Streptomyces sp. MBRL 10]|nr:hypothetical protein SF23_01100 [Streptomyces sp. MBRL 10]